MKRRAIPFRELLERVLPVDRLPLGDQLRVRQALEKRELRTLEAVGLDTLDRLADLGHLRLLTETLQGDETIRRYRDLTSGNTIAVRLPVIEEDGGWIRIPLPLRDWRGSTSLDQIRSLMSLHDKLLSRESDVVRGPADVLRQILLTARDMLGCERVSFWSPGVPGAGPEPFLDLAGEPYDESVERTWVLGERYLVVHPDLPAEISRQGGGLEIRFRSLALLPVGVPGETLHGVLQAWSARPRHFTEERLGLLSLLSEAATDLLKQGEILEDLVFVDAGTRVYNRSYFNLQLDREMARAHREETSLALAIVDLDDFRAVNSRYGYEAGNEVLTAVARVLQSGLRPFDSVARWGGEEFALILSSPVSEEDARAVCERLRRGTQETHIPAVGLTGESVSIHVTASIGAAMFPADGTTAAELWRAANAALLVAKRSGKDRVAFASQSPSDRVPRGPTARGPGPPSADGDNP